ncbi:helix-turn-helix transcriptional regulator [Proteus faecis]|uniref:Helix-turn-helix transcriptional regulator n=1 Tax=Proteus faecis TaxID=2050967 RepID=A0AAW7CJC2_9GAMM|nr:helix-turn-helix transcriptional regulator [Proteus faecis]MBG3014085.1 helix-turn-helix transcriptional regulator [Proteus mirabilis]MDL5166367.1 helix-turn-helix transcriptional regulator [Proteus faecis]MDL5274351.1 helix-turn-helix transcriptional regulator [Proteus faecis]MDL5277921.1 helix-turn-helix transcriptional regulator [Proteus faecis]MDL5306911.1 helix-turn-helix transcriptional regulator [Proteus faecis]
MINTRVGNRIKMIRKQLKITENEMSERLGMTMLHYSQLEDGHIKITVDQLVTISYILGVTPQSLILEAKETDFMVFEDKNSVNQPSEIVIFRKKKVI